MSLLLSAQSIVIAQVCCTGHSDVYIFCIVVVCSLCFWLDFDVEAMLVVCFTIFDLWFVMCAHIFQALYLLYLVDKDEAIKKWNLTSKKNKGVNFRKHCMGSSGVLTNTRMYNDLSVIEECCQKQATIILYNIYQWLDHVPVQACNWEDAWLKWMTMFLVLFVILLCSIEGYDVIF